MTDLCPHCGRETLTVTTSQYPAGDKTVRDCSGCGWCNVSYKLNHINIAPVPGTPRAYRWLKKIFKAELPNSERLNRGT